MPKEQQQQLLFETELADPFWSKSYRKQYARSWGLAGRSDPLSKLGGGRDDGQVMERQSSNWSLIDSTAGATKPRVVLNNMIGARVMGPGPQYETAAAFEHTGRFSSFASFQLLGRDAWRESDATALEKNRPKTPANLLTMAPVHEELPAVKKIKDKRKKLEDAAALLEQMASPIKDPIGPGYYDHDRPVRQELLSNLTTAGRTRIAPADAGARVRRTILNHVDLFEDRTDYRRYNVTQAPGVGCRKAFFTTESRADPGKSATNVRVGPGSYDPISALAKTSPASPKARWLAKYTFSKDAESAVPFSKTYNFKASP